MPQEHPQPRDEFYDDLHPQPQAGFNVEGVGPRDEQDARTAYDLKAAHQRLRRYADDDLKQIPVLPAGSRLLQGATYIDLAVESPTEFTATANMTAGEDNLYIPKSEVDYQLWNRLIGVKNKERRGE